LHAKNLEEHADELAYHFEEGGNDAKALEYFLKAGDRAMKMYANEEASSYFESALNLLNRTDGAVREKARVTEVLGHLKNWNMEYEASVKYHKEALRLLKKLGDNKGLARVSVSMSETLTFGLGGYEDALANLNEVVKILENEPESPELAEVYEEIAFLHYNGLGGLSEAVPLGRKALDLSEKLGALKVKAGCYCELTFTELVDIQEAIKYVKEGLKIALENNFTELAVIDGYFYLPLHYEALGDFHRAMEYAEEGLEFARKVGCLIWSGWMIAEIAKIYTWTGELRKAREIAEEAIQTSKKSGHLTSLAYALYVRGNVYQIMGELDKAHEYYVQSLETSKRLPAAWWFTYLNSSLGRLCYEKQEYNKAEEILQKQIEILERTGGKTRCPVQFFHWGFVPYIWLSEVRLKMGHFKKAKDLADVAYEAAVKSKSRLYMAMANRLKGMILSCEKDWESALESFEKSKKAFEAMNALPELIPTLYEYGSTYLQRNQEGDREKAHSHLDQALEISRKIGAKKWIEKIIAKKKLLTA